MVDVVFSGELRDPGIVTANDDFNRSDFRKFLPAEDGVSLNDTNVSVESLGDRIDRHRRNLGRKFAGFDDATGEICERGFAGSFGFGHESMSSERIKRASRQHVDT